MEWLAIAEAYILNIVFIWFKFS